MVETTKKGKPAMTTVKQIERTWAARQYERLYRDLIMFRPEATLKAERAGALRNGRSKGVRSSW